MMKLLSLILPSRIADMVPVDDQAVLPTTFGISQESRKYAMLNCALLMALFGTGSIMAKIVDSRDFCLAMYGHFLVFVGNWYQIDPDAKLSMIIFWLTMSVLTLALSLIPLFVLAVSEMGAFVLSAVSAPLLGFWMTALSLEWMGAVGSVLAGVAVAICGLVFLAGFRFSALVMAAIMIAIMQPWTYQAADGANLLGSAAMFGVIFPGAIAFAVMTRVHAILGTEAHGLNEVNAPVVAFSLLVMAASLFFIFVLARSVVRRRALAEPGP